VLDELQFQQILLLFGGGRRRPSTNTPLALRFVVESDDA
jgi:hypothetical protein